MKKFLLLSAIMAVAISSQAQGTFNKGERKIDLTVGIGMVDYAYKPLATFDQHFGMEWGIARIADKVTIGVGFAVNNTYGGKYQGLVIGQYDYKYYRTTTGSMYSFITNKWSSINDQQQITRKGEGSADADIAREDVNALVTVSFHFTPIPKLDTYLKVGCGVGCMTYIIGNYRNEQGFKSENVNNHMEDKYTDITTRYYYNDLDHTQWSSFDPKVVPAIATYVGATYYLTNQWGIEAQFGLISANLNDDYPNSYSMFAIGATYKF